MLEDSDKTWIVEKVGAIVRQSISGIDSRTRGHSGELAEMRYNFREGTDRIDRIEAALEKLVEANNTTAESVAKLSVKVDQLVEALLHPGGNGKAIK